MPVVLLATLSSINVFRFITLAMGICFRSRFMTELWQPTEQEVNSKNPREHGPKMWNGWNSISRRTT